MRLRAQGAMEYLMTYGWAILIVMVVGVAMYTLGMFNMSGSVPPTATGFGPLKPLLATCEVKEKTWWPIYDGFSCQFANSVGTSIKVKDINVTANNILGSNPQVELNPTFTASTSIRVYRTNNMNCYVDLSCYNYNLGKWCDSRPGGTNAWLDIPQDSQFSVALLSIKGDHTAFDPIQDGMKYDVYIDITYDVTIGGVTSTKHSTGHIFLTAKK
jgi:hypothetical protein